MKAEVGKFQELFVYVADDEGVVGFQTPDGIVPMVTHREDVCEQMKVRAATMARASGKPISLLYFSNPEVITTWGGKPSG